MAGITPQIDRNELRRMAREALFSANHDRPKLQSPISSPKKRTAILLLAALLSVAIIISGIWYIISPQNESIPSSPIIRAQSEPPAVQTVIFDQCMEILSLHEVKAINGQLLALISMGNQQPRSYFLGEELVKNAILSEIKSDHVLIQYNDSIITLYLNKTATTLAAAEKPGAPPEESDTSVEPQDYYDSIEKAEYFQNNIEVIPNPTGMGGYVVKRVEPMSGYGLFGVQPGDIFFHRDAIPAYDAQEGAYGLEVFRNGNRILLK